MAVHPWPKAPIKLGEQPAPEVVDILQGTSPAELQRIIGANWHTSGIKPTGGVTVKGTSSMAYLVTAGSVVLKTAAGLGLEYAVEQQTVNTLPAPATGTREDRIVMDRDGLVYVTQGAAPGGGITLGLFVVPAGIAATTSAQQSVDRNFAVPAGGSLGLLHQFHDPANAIKGNVSPITLGVGRTRPLPSDSWVRFDMTHCLSAIQEGTTDQPSAAIRWRVYIDDVLELAFTTRVTRAAPQTNFMSFTKQLSEGVHKVHYIQDQIEGLSGPGWMHHKGTNQGYPGNRFEVWHVGVAQ
ncbi:hypothetical protein DEU31_3063 [Brachybacterium sp. AG952]|uniref:hypothetical protein n=1 Tax=Brachybacterium sp. AG952 TaxID=2183989 RepID=UPI00105F4F29|nr:hypothetical protein [Brachybacterium sp. AG952]TDP76355.1 hypothetical protein DEU31_3063 [Brachybacterium sp. AG952]